MNVLYEHASLKYSRNSTPCPCSPLPPPLLPLPLLPLSYPSSTTPPLFPHPHPPPSPPTPTPKVTKIVVIANTTYLSDSTYSLSQCLCTDDLDMMSHVYRYCPSVMVWNYCGHIPTLYCYTTHCAHRHKCILTVPLLSCTDHMSLCSQIYTELCHYTIQVRSDYSCII